MASEGALKELIDIFTAKLTESNTLFLHKIDKLNSDFATRLDSLQKSFSDSLASITDQVNVSIQQSHAAFTSLSSVITTQNSLFESRLAKLESSQTSSPVSSNIALYSALVQFKSDESKIEEKSKRITWVGVDEKSNDTLTAQFDKDALEEVVTATDDSDLITAFRTGQITSHRHPPNRRVGSDRPRIVKVVCPNQILRDRLLVFMKSKRQSLTSSMFHSYARRDYTQPELDRDSDLRKEAGRRNSSAGKLQWIVRDLALFQLRTPRDLPSRLADRGEPPSKARPPTSSTAKPRSQSLSSSVDHVHFNLPLATPNSNVFTSQLSSQDVEFMEEDDLSLGSAVPSTSANSRRKNSNRGRGSRR